MRWAVAFGLSMLAAAGAQPEPPGSAIALRVGSIDPGGFRLEIANVFSGPVEYPVRLTVRLTRLDETKGPEHAKHIWSHVDPQSGQYREMTPMRKPPQLALEKGQVKTIKVRYEELRWFYPSIGTRTPERIADLAEAGEFDLSILLQYEPGGERIRPTTAPTLYEDVGPIRVRLHVRISASPNKELKQTKRGKLRSFAA